MIKKIGDSPRPFSSGKSRGGGRIVANGASYNGFTLCCKRIAAVQRLTQRGGKLAMVTLQISLLTAAAAVFTNIWLGWRIARFREQFKVSVGDGGHEPLLRRMRAQSNFIEQAPFFLILTAGLELSGANRPALAMLAGVFILSRIAHGIGMDGGPLHRWRVYGISGSTLSSLIMAAWAVVHAAAILLDR